MNQITPNAALRGGSATIDRFSLDYYTTSQGWVRILREVSIAIERGEVVGLVGESGCGKSSLAYNLLGYRAGNSRITSGQIAVADTAIDQLSRKELDRVRGKVVALVPQNPTTALSPHLRIRTQMREMLVQHRYSTSSADLTSRMKELLVLVGLTETDRILNSFPHELSGGQQQRITIAMALSCDPEVLVLDEPTTGLDVTTQNQIILLLASLKQRIGLAMLYVTHDLNVLSQIADRVVVMYAGNVAETAPVETIFHAPHHPYTRGLIGSIPNIRQTARNELRLQGILRRSELGEGCPFAARCQHRQEICTDQRPELEAAGPKHTVACHFWRDLPYYDPRNDILEPEKQALGDRDVVLSLDDVSISYEGSGLLKRLTGHSAPAVVRDVNFTVRQGEIVALVGESGSGKSTIAKTIIGMLPNKQGQITYKGSTELGPLKSRGTDILREIQYVFQNPDDSLNPRRTVGSTLSHAVRRFRPGITQTDLRDRVVRALQSVQLDESYVHRYPSQLSGGERQRIAIARGLAVSPSLLLCDEILSALDVSVQAKVIDVLLDLRKQQDISLLFISHDLSVVRAIADQVVVLYKGEIMERGPTERIYAPPFHPYTHILLSAVPEVGRAAKQSEKLADPAPLSAGGCVFANRCPWKKGAICDSEKPPVHRDGDLSIQCHHDPDKLTELATWHMAPA